MIIGNKYSIKIQLIEKSKNNRTIINRFWQTEERMLRMANKVEEVLHSGTNMNNNNIKAWTSMTVIFKYSEKWSASRMEENLQKLLTTDECPECLTNSNNWL